MAKESPRVKTTNGFMSIPVPDTKDGFEPYKPSKTDRLPNFTVDASIIPESKDWEVGDEYELTVKVIMTRYEASQGKKRVSFAIESIKSNGGETADSDVDD